MARRGVRYFAHPRRALWIGAALLAVVALIAVVVPAEPLALERTWLEAMQDIQTAALKNLALVFNWLGRGIGRALSIAAIGIVLLVARRWLGLLAFAVTETLTPLCSSLLKAHVDRPRPPDGLIEPPAGASFPSGHAAYAGATCVVVVLLFTAPGPRRRLWWTIAALGIAGMAWSRTYLQVHWLIDVIAGSLLGIGVALVTFAAVQQLWRGRQSSLSAGSDSIPVSRR